MKRIDGMLKRTASRIVRPAVTLRQNNARMSADQKLASLSSVKIRVICGSFLPVIWNHITARSLFKRCWQPNNAFLLSIRSYSGAMGVNNGVNKPINNGVNNGVNKMELRMVLYRAAALFPRQLGSLRLLVNKAVNDGVNKPVNRPAGYRLRLRWAPRTTCMCRSAKALKTMTFSPPTVVNSTTRVYHSQIEMTAL